MKKILTIAFVCAGLSFSSKNAEAQELNFDTFLEAGLDDANALLGAYLAPAFEGFGFGLNAGWYNTAKPHKFLGFDITVGASFALVPSGREFFTFPQGLTNVELSDPNDNLLPTLLGPNLGADDLPELRFLDDNGDELIRLSAPTGLGIEEGGSPFNAVPVPMAQLGLGLFKGTEVKLRFVPSISFGDDDEVTTELFGIGVMHDIKQYLPADKLLPFDLSLFVGYTRLESEIVIDSDLNQSAVFEATAINAQAIISKKFAFLTLFGGVGYTNTDVEFGLRGRFETESNVFNDPIDLNFENNGFRANAGLRLKLLVLTLSGEYTFQEFNTVNLGLGISIR